LPRCQPILCRQLRQKKKVQHIPIIVSTDQHHVFKNVTSRFCRLRGQVELSGTPEFPCWVIGKIDAILREPTGWRVIDFKTGHVATRRDFALTTLNKYALQLGVYSLAIANWTGQLPGPLELVWLPRGERLRFQPDRPFLDRIGRLLDWCLARARQPGALETERVRDLPAETLEEDLWAPDRG